MSGYVYILECADGTYYTGSTRNLAKRLREHENFKGAHYTQKKHPVKLVYAETFKRIDLAFAREKQIQGWSHAKKRALIEKKVDVLHGLSECKNKSHCMNRVAAVTSTSLSDRLNR
jgi:putative endonuclease